MPNSLMSGPNEAPLIVLPDAAAITADLSNVVIVAPLKLRSETLKSFQVTVTQPLGLGALPTVTPSFGWSKKSVVLSAPTRNGVQTDGSSTLLTARRTPLPARALPLTITWVAEAKKRPE